MKSYCEIIKKCITYLCVETPSPSSFSSFTHSANILTSCSRRKGLGTHNCATANKSRTPWPAAGSLFWKNSNFFRKQILSVSFLIHLKFQQRNFFLFLPYFLSPSKDNQTFQQYQK